MAEDVTLRRKLYMLINRERERQEELHPIISDNVDSEFFIILSEEVGEVAKAIQEEDEDNLIEEVIQVAAVCLRWLENR